MIGGNSFRFFSRGILDWCAGGLPVKGADVENLSSPQHLSVLERKKSPAYNNAYILLGVT
jgi:hypothetical protein